VCVSHSHQHNNNKYTHFRPFHTLSSMVDSTLFDPHIHSVYMCITHTHTPWCDPTLQHKVQACSEQPQKKKGRSQTSNTLRDPLCFVSHICIPQMLMHSNSVTTVHTLTRCALTIYASSSQPHTPHVLWSRLFP